MGGPSFDGPPPVGGPPPGGAPPMENNPLMEPAAPLNEDGLPVRPDREACLYYLNTGICRSGPQCIFHHPPKGERDAELQKSLNKAGVADGPAGDSMVPMMPVAPPDSIDGAPVGGPPPGGLSDGMQGMLEKLEALQGTVQPPEGGEVKPPEEPAVEVPIVAPEPPKVIEYNDEGLPMRPGEQKCGSFLRSGRCNYGPSCRFDHPAGLGGLLAGGSGFGALPGMQGFGAYPGALGEQLTQGSMAMRPGKEQCPFLSRTGSCPFGPECRFDHSGAKDSIPGAPVLAKPAAPAASRKKEKGLGGTKSRRPPPMRR